MTDSTYSNSEMLGLNDNPESNEMGSSSHNNNPENSFDEVFSLLESTLIDLKENDSTICLDRTDIDIDLNNPVGICELGITKDVLSSDNSSSKEVGLDCKFCTIDNSSMKNSVEMVDNCTDNQNVCQCSSTQSEKCDNITCSYKVCSDNSLKYCSLILPPISKAGVMEGDNEAKIIQMSTITELKPKVSKPVFCNCLKICNCLSSVVVQHLGLAEDHVDTKDEIKQNHPIGLKFGTDRPTCIDDATHDSIVKKEAVAKTSDIVLEAETRGGCDQNNLVTLEMKLSPEQQNIEINTQLNEAIDEIVNEDELLANDEENLNINGVSLDCITMENNVSLEEELLLDDKESEIILNKNICAEKVNHIITENFIRDTTKPTEEIEMPLDKKMEFKLKSIDMNLEDISTVSIKLDADNELKSECTQDSPTVSKEFKTITDQINPTNDLENEVPTKLFCSTPIADYKLSCKTFSEKVKNRDFGSMSPLGINSALATEETVVLKRKVGNLIPIKEEDEEIDSSSAKRIKTEENNLNLDVSRKNLSRKTLEAPAVSLLKKWRPSCLSRNSYYVIDESGNEGEDDYEDAIKSLSETLMKESEMNGSTAHEEYQKYVLAENSLDNLKFTEIMQEMTQEMQDQFNDEDRFFEDINEVTVIENTIVETNNELIPAASKENSTFQLELKENLNQSKSCQIFVERKDRDKNVNELSSKPSKILETDNNLSIIYSNEEDKNNDDEEDLLLKEGEFDDKLKTKRRDLEFFISNDPMENADNTNKEWDLLRKLSTDEERYKAVRERWRSLTIPDPKKDLTFRQWRVRNNLPPLSKNKTTTQKRLQKVNEPATRLCTALFDQNIEQIIGHLEFKRKEVRRALERELQCLAFQQKHQQEELFINCASQNQIYNLHCCHIKEVHAVKSRYESEFKNEERISHERIDALKTASEEVLAFEKYYQGLDGDKPFRNRNSILLTDTEIEELLETECMLEQYDRYYDGR